MSDAETAAPAGPSPEPRSAHAAVAETWPAVFRAALIVLGAVAITHEVHEVAKTALGVLALVASPAPIRAVVAPMLAKILREAARP